MFLKNFFFIVSLLPATATLALEQNSAFPFTIRQIEENSVANYSFLNHKPAGKYGFLRNKEGDFTFENGQKIRFFGINLVDDRVVEMNDSQTESWQKKWRLSVLIWSACIISVPSGSGQNRCFLNRKKVLSSSMMKLWSALTIFCTNSKKTVFMLQRRSWILP